MHRAYRGNREFTTIAKNLSKLNIYHYEELETEILQDGNTYSLLLELAMNFGKDLLCQF